MHAGRGALRGTQVAVPAAADHAAQQLPFGSHLPGASSILSSHMHGGEVGYLEERLSACLCPGRMGSLETRVHQSIASCQHPFRLPVKASQT